MRILHLDPDDVDNPLSGGGPVRTFELYRRLVPRHQVTVLTPTFPGSTPEVMREGIRYVRLGRKIGSHGSSHHITFFFSLPWAILRQPYDLVVEDFMPPFGTSFATMLTRRPVVASVQWFSADELGKRYNLPFGTIQRLSLRLYKNYVALTPSMDQHIRAITPGANVAVVPNGVSQDLFDVPIEPGNTILYLGRVDLDMKGVRPLLHAYARLPLEQRLPLVLAGFGWEWDALRALASELGILDRIQILGRVDAARRRDLLRACRFLCFPSPVETFGMGIAEACAAGKPVIYFDKAPMNEIAAGAGCLAVKPFDVADYSAAMSYFVTASDAEMHSRGAACRARVQGYQWDAVARQQEAFYESVVARGVLPRHAARPSAAGAG